MNDKIVNIAFTLASNRGAYAILLGSGVSRAAGIPTGWEITLDLIKKYAQRIDGVDILNPEEWYRTKFKEEPNYSDVLNRIFQTSTERSRAIKGYIEASNIGVREPKKIEPTNAHRAIARLVQMGIIKVIISTNFDRLMENALDELKITPQVITNADDIRGSIPLSHSDSTLIKINGDYLDTRTKNTMSELNQYNRNLKKLLTGIVNDYGLIICGWSGEWDKSLVDCLLAKCSKRYWIYWVTKAIEPSEKAKNIINHHRADLITSMTADVFFENLTDSVLAIIENRQTNPVSIEIAIELTKKYLAEAKYFIKLHDLIINETNELINAITVEGYKHTEQWSVEEFRKRVLFYETKSEILLNILKTCAYFGDDAAFELIRKSLSLLLNSIKTSGGLGVYINLAKYPTLFIMYPVLISSLFNDKTKLFKSILVDISFKFNNFKGSSIFEINSSKVFTDNAESFLPGQNNRTPYPVSQYLRERLFEYLKSFIPNENQYQEVFDRMEYYLALIYASFDKDSKAIFWAPVGDFERRTRGYSSNQTIPYIITSEIETLRTEHPLLKAGLFNSSFEELSSVNQRLIDFLRNFPWR
jgi:hypothetical protein